MELVDSDFFIGPPELIDRFVINVTSPTAQVTGSYPGIFGFATIDITTEIVCEPEFTGKYCTAITTHPTAIDLSTTMPNASGTVGSTAIASPMSANIATSVIIPIVILSSLK